jgi:hypothetical protein
LDAANVNAPALSIEKVDDGLGPPAGAGLKTVMSAVPIAARSAARIVAVNWVALTNVVARVEPFQRTVAPETKPLPVTVRTRLVEPAVAVIGDRPAIDGIPFGTAGAADTVIVPPL